MYTNIYKCNTRYKTKQLTSKNSNSNVSQLILDVTNDETTSRYMYNNHIQLLEYVHSTSA